MRFHDLCPIVEGDDRAFIEYTHDDRFVSSTAYELCENVALYVKIPRSFGTCRAILSIFDESLSRQLSEVVGELTETIGAYDVYLFTPDIKKLGVGLYFMRPIIYCFGECFFGRKNRYGEVAFSKEDALCSLFQLSVCDFSYQRPEALYGGLIYHIFVDRFRRGGSVNHHVDSRVISGEWALIPEYPEYPGAPVKNNTFYGGTLYGVIEKLDYIASLGVTAIYLSPIFESHSNHKYDTADYMNVDSGFGGDEALSALISEAEKRGIKIILDGVFNHTGADSIYFNKYGRYSEKGAYQSMDSRYFDWYRFEEFPEKYVSWWDIEILPRINPDKSSCAEYFLCDNGVIKKYRDMGIYGFRLDVCDELSDDFVSRIKDKLSEGGENILYGEVWEDGSNKIAYDTRKRYYLGRELDGVMNYPLRRGLLDFIMKKETDTLSYALSEVFSNAPDRIMHVLMNFLGTHDTERILTSLSGEHPSDKRNSVLRCFRMSGEARENALTKLSSLYTVLATLPGVPSIFYGDEAGLEGFNDPFNRMPYPWGAEDNSLIAHFRKIGALRKDNSVYKKGGFKLLYLSPDILAFERISEGGYAYITILNNSDSQIELAFPEGAYALVDEAMGKVFNLAPLSCEVYKYFYDKTFDIKQRI